MTDTKIVAGQKIIFIHSTGDGFNVKAIKGHVIEHADTPEYMTTFRGLNGHTYCVATVRLDICNDDWFIVGYANGRGEIHYTY